MHACRLEAKSGTLAAENAGEVLAAIARARCCPLTAVLSSPASLQRLLGIGLDSGRSTALVQVSFLIA